MIFYRSEKLSSTICNYIYRTQHTDISSFKQSKHKIEEFIYDKNNRPRQQREKHTGIGRINTNVNSGEAAKEPIPEQKEEKRIKKGFYISTGGVSNWRDDILHSYIMRNNPKSIPPRVTEITKRSVLDSDETAKQSYNTPSRFFSRGKSALFSSAGKRALEQLLRAERTSKGSIFSTSETDVILEKLKKDTNSGHPEYGRKNDVNVLKNVKDWLNGAISDIRQVTFNNILVKHPCYLEENKKLRPISKSSSLLILPTQIFHRFQPVLSEGKSSYEIKIRQVWCIPFRIVALEAYFFLKMTERLKYLNMTEELVFTSSGLNAKEIGTKCVKRLMMHRNRLGYESDLYSIDYSKFDRNIPSFCFDLFFGLVKEQFEMNEIDSNLYDLLRIYVKYTPYIMNGELNFKMKGVPSGLFITSFIDSFWNLTLWIVSDIISEQMSRYLNDLLKCSFREFENSVEVAIKSGVIDAFTVPPDKLNINVTGDDTLVCCHYDDILIHKQVCSSIGMTVNLMPEVDQIGGYVFYLGRYWDEFGIPYQTDEYKSIHCIERSKFYDKSIVEFEDKEELSLYRMLSICLPFRNAFDYIERTFGDWPTYRKFMREKRSFKLLKDWPSEVQFREVEFRDIPSILLLV